MRAYLLLPILAGAIVLGVFMARHAETDPLGFLGIAALLAAVASLVEVVAGHLRVSERDSAPGPVRPYESFGVSVGLSATALAIAAGAAEPVLSLGADVRAATADVAPVAIGLLLALWVAPGLIGALRATLGALRGGSARSAA